MRKWKRFSPSNQVLLARAYLGWDKYDQAIELAELAIAQFEARRADEVALSERQYSFWLVALEITGRPVEGIAQAIESEIGAV